VLVDFIICGKPLFTSYFRYQQVILASLAALVASAPTETKTVINVDGPDGQHVQTGEPGKAVSGYFT
jgi:hypothetical protein